MKKLTIFTPTYNREKKIVDTYNSLINQVNKDFVWLVVDDGSVDNTFDLIEKFRQENKIEIQYYKKENGGKHSAFNYALNKINTDYVYISLDSDDILFSDDTTDNIIKMLKNINDDYVGLVTLCTTDINGCDRDNKFIKKYDVDVLKDKGLADAYKENLFNAECRFIFKTEYLRNFKYPEILNEKFFTEAYTYWQMNEKIIWTDLNTCYSNYLADGLTSNTNKLFINNPVSWYLYNELRFKNTNIFYLKFKYCMYYISFAILSKSKIFKKGINKLYILLMFPLALLGVTYLKYKGRKK